MRRVWVVLAAIDALILAFVISQFPWGYNTAVSGSSPLGELLVYLAHALDIVVNLAAAAFVAAVVDGPACDAAIACRARGRGFHRMA